MIVVTTPTGTIGHQVLDELLDAGQQVRTVVRDPARLPDEVHDRAEVVGGSHGDAELMRRVLDGADALFWVLPNDVQSASVDASYSGFARPIAQLLPSTSVRRVVDVSALGRGTAWADRAGYVTASLAMDDLFAESGIAFRALACASFMDNTARQVDAIAGAGSFFAPATAGAPQPVVATRDIASNAARLLADDSWSGHGEVPLLGPEDLTTKDLIATMSDVLGREIRLVPVALEAFRAQLTDRGMSHAMADGMVDMMDAKDHGLDLGVTRTPQHAIDTPTTFRQWCIDVLAPAVAQAQDSSGR